MIPAALASRFPPSFENNPLTYGWALFSLTLVSALSLAVLVGYGLDARRKREVDRLLGNPLPPPWAPPVTPILLHRLIVSGLMLTIVLGALPDVLVLLAWGEASERTMEIMFAIDRMGDGSVMVPFLGSTFLLVWAGQAVDHRLAVEALPITLKPSWFMVRDKLKMAAVVLLIAIGVTFGKTIAG